MEEARNLQVMKNVRTNESTSSSKSRNAKVTAVRDTRDGKGKE